MEKNLNGDVLNALVKGRHMEAIFGYCDIRGFTVATEVLQAKVTRGVLAHLKAIGLIEVLVWIAVYAAVSRVHGIQYA